MKIKRIVLILLVSLVSGVIWAQPRLRQPEIYVGAHAGAMASTVMFKPSIGLNLLQSPISPNGGLVFRYAGHKVCAIQVELNYMQRGWQEINENNTMKYSRKLDYIEVPLLMHLYFGGQKMRGFFNLGPQIGYCFRDTQSGEQTPKYKYQYAPIDNPFDWGLAGGLGIYYRTNKIGLFQLEVRANYSFGNLYDNSKTAHFEFSNPLNASLNLAYMWEIKIK